MNMELHGGRRAGKIALHAKNGVQKGGRTLGAAIAGVSVEDEAKCDEFNRSGQELRASVCWRIAQGKGPILAEFTAVPLERLQKFVDTGELSEQDRRFLEAMQ